MKAIPSPPPAEKVSDKLFNFNSFEIFFLLLYTVYIYTLGQNDFYGN